MTKLTAVVDADFIAYAVASAGEKRTVIVTHKPSGRQIEVGTRTEWHGDWRKRDGGMLAEINAKRTSPFDPDEFEFEDVQTPEPIENVLHSAKTMFTSTYKNAGTEDYIGFLGGSNNFRDDVATIWKYKGDRENLIKPLYLKDVREYLSRKFSLEIVDGYEADDAVVMEAHGRRDRVVISPDKDTGGNHVMWYNPHKPEQGIVDCMKLGKLFLDDKGEVRGFGRIFFYYQCASGDRADCYAANSACGKRWGDKSAYKSLVDCKTDKEALIALKEVYQKLYPEPLTIIGWRGDQLDVDWKYVLNENWQLARMIRSVDEIENPILATDVMVKMGIEL